jgi:hypothetical protein
MGLFHVPDLPVIIRGTPSWSGEGLWQPSSGRGTGRSTADLLLAIREVGGKIATLGESPAGRSWSARA